LIEPVAHCSCAAVFSALNGSRGFLGAWTLRRSSAQVPVPGPAASIPRSLVQGTRNFSPGYPAADIDDLLAFPSSLHKYLQGKAGCNTASVVAAGFSRIMLSFQLQVCWITKLDLKEMFGAA
jgi:hypothetical protein